MSTQQHGTQGIKPHLPNSGVCGHSAGDIFPYVIVLVGTLDAIKYHVIGNGLDWDITHMHNTYDSAHEWALLCLEYDELDVWVHANLK